MPRNPKLIAALAIALLADFLQVVFFPFFFAGALSAVNDALDFAVAATLTALLGWHWVFLPSALAELVPGLDMAPFWSGAVFYVALKKPQTATAPLKDANAKTISGSSI
jgi:hypothetical protein